MSIVIAGAGEAGTRTALALRSKGFAGTISLLGAEAIDPYERPPLSKDVITSAEPTPKHISRGHEMERVGIDFQPSTVVQAIDRDKKALHTSQGTLSYQTLIIATGARARSLTISGLDPQDFHVLRSYGDATTLRDKLLPGKRLVIIGGGFIGLELAASARKRGAEVTVIEGLERILKRGVPAEVASAIASRHQAEGVRILTGCAIIQGRRSGSELHLDLSDGGTLDADILVAGIGAEPVTELAAGAGLAIENGIMVDAALRTEDPAIFAIGDCCSFPVALYGGRRLRLESWRNALEQANFLAACFTGKTEPFDQVPWFWSDQYDLTLQVAGMIDEGATTVRRDIAEDAFVLFHLSGDGRLVAASGISRGNAAARDIRLAEMLIARRASPAPGDLANPELKLKSLLLG
jgi:3-phenylpropionate/trans-cinnamate dioxygenase ferredoxin reductase component